MNSFLKEHSHKYLATILQIVGIGCASPLSSKIYNAALSGEIGEFSPGHLGFRLSLGLLCLGFIVLLLGWYIMYRTDRRKSLVGGLVR